MESEGARLYLTEMVEGRFSVILHHENEGNDILPAATPAEDLIAAAEIDYSDYRREVERLWDEHPLFEERPIIRVAEPRSMRGVSRADFDDFTAQASALLAVLQPIDPAGFLWARDRLWLARQAEDDGSATWLLNTGYQFFQILRVPFRVQARLRNMMEIAFDGMERASQQERFEKLRDTYPNIGQRCDPSKLTAEPKGKRVFAAHSLLDLRLLELALYFRQDDQRIARCDYCWRYFIPKTKKATRYCDRVTDGQTCKQRGANLARLDATEEDEALLICKRLRSRMYSRFLRYEDAAPWERDGLLPMPLSDYDAWSEHAQSARKEYLDGKLTVEAFLRRIDTTHELTCYEAGKATLSYESDWQRRVARNLDFDPEVFYPEKMQYLDLTPGADNEWKTFTKDDLRRRDQQGHQSLREKYGKG